MNIRHDEDGFLVSQKAIDDIADIKENTKALLKQGAVGARARVKPKAVKAGAKVSASNTAATAKAKAKTAAVRAKAAAVKQTGKIPQMPSESKPKPVTAREREERKKEAAQTAKTIAKAVKAADNEPSNTAKQAQVNREAAIRRKTDKVQKDDAAEQKKQTRALDELVKASKKQGGNGSGGGLLGVLGGLGGLVKGGFKVPLNVLRGGRKGAGAIRGADGRYLPKGAKMPPTGVGAGLLGKMGKAGGLLKGMGKGGLLAAAFGLLEGVNIERSDADRAEKNKAHVKNVSAAAGGIAGAKLGAMAGSMIAPGIGTAVGALVGGIGGAVMTEHFVERVDKAIDPKLSRKMFKSWEGFTDVAKKGMGRFFNALPKPIQTAVQTASDAYRNAVEKVGAATDGEEQKRRVKVANEEIGREMQAVATDKNLTQEQKTQKLEKLRKEAENVYKTGSRDGGLTGAVANSAPVLALKNSKIAQTAGKVAQSAQKATREIGNAIGRKVSSTLGYDMTKKYLNTVYKFGGGSLTGGIDCSHWTFEVGKMEVGELNKMLGHNKYKAEPYRTAEGQIKYFSDKYGVVTDRRDNGGIDYSKIKAGMLIGQHKFSNGYQGNGGINVKGYGHTRYNHIAKVVRGEDGRLYVSESQGGSKTNNGVTLTELKKWFSKREKRGDNLTVVNPYGDDIGLLNGEIGAVVRNEAAKAAKAVSEKAAPVVQAVSDGIRYIKGEAGGGKGLDRIYTAEDGQTHIRKGGSRAWRNNNEGNLEYGKFAQKYGAIGTDGRFAIFPTEEHGIRAKKALIFESKNYKNLSLKDAVNRYAPKGENNTEMYYNTVLKAVGTDKKMGDYTEKEREAIVHAMRKVEGWKAGNIVTAGGGKSAAPTAVKAQAPQKTTAQVPVPVPVAVQPQTPQSAKAKTAKPKEHGLFGGNESYSIARMAHKPVGRTVSNDKIAHVASGGIMGHNT